MSYGLSLAQQTSTDAIVQAAVKVVVSSPGVGKLASGLVFEVNLRLATLAQAAARSAAGVNCSTSARTQLNSALLSSGAPVAPASGLLCREVAFGLLNAIDSFRPKMEVSGSTRLIQAIRRPSSQYV